MYKQAAGVTSVENQIRLGTFWQVVRFEWAGANPLYKGCHYEAGAGTDDAEWEIWKFSLTGSDITLIEGPIKGSWDNRASLAWA